MKSTQTKRKKRRTSQMAGTTLCVLYFRGARPLYLCFSLPLLKGKAIVVPGKATPIHFSITPHRLPFGGAGTFPHSRRGLYRAKCSWRPTLGLPPCVTAFRLVFRSFLFDGKELSAFYHTPPPYKKSRGLGEVCEHSQIHGIFLGRFDRKVHAQQNKPPRNFFLRGFV